ncbi:MAG: TonB-dependent receptor [Pseudoalteromonas rhizosphaerae]|jgi:TonB-dependent receptor|uniref:TonB-dependent receptor n=1 Tax=Pseudoalteromonas neustonica TaxID=1840331 RepID=A0ABY3FFR9_9GAMM|nr:MULTISPECIES: TonB-dependent receptor [Pseudoalteromonas]MBB1331719.1 TonB-dependent receptor [Pseudoalteromonas sp. SR41-6]MBB1341397.1 TonB-dependent receptor [Pseudoalteromonas sp. SR45-6]MBB1458737.1 TonB-dependent receptor [Pseudoalteromonas sp. SG41-8]MBB1507274.1 TonB-dependent receptor [Pseudoalteromonas sp. SG41-1]TVU84625.1 TonB-dependent receptor [Pseudoalteromonas neustonica]
MNPFIKSSIALACCGILYATPALADGRVQGRITDASQSVYFGGAKVSVKELNLNTVSNRDGSFSFNKLPAGDYTLVVDYIGAPSVEQKITVVDSQVFTQQIIIGEQQEAIDNIIVYGQSAGQAGAINRQKNATNLKSVVSADSIGQFPDQNAAEALQRLPGIFIARDQGEGRFVGIRGIDPNLNNVTVNGLNVPSPEAGVRSVAMDVLPSELIQSLEVSKTVTPDMDASAIGGSIEVKSLSAFDKAGESYSFTAQGSYNELESKTSPKLSGSYTNVYELDGGLDLGVATAISWFKRDFGSRNMETDGGWSEFDVEDAATGDKVSLFGAEEIEQRQYQITRERLGAALNLDLHSGATDKYYLRTLYSDFSDDEYRQRNEYKFSDGKLLDSNESGANFSGAEMDRDTKDRYEEQSILSLVLGGENQLDNWFVEYNVGYSKSEEKEPNRLDVTFAGKDIDMGYIARVDTPLLSQSTNAHDLSLFEMDKIEAANNLSEDEELSFKLDFSRDFVWQNNNGEFKFGFKHQNREKRNDVKVAIYDGDFLDALGSDFVAPAPDFDLGSFGPGLDRGAIQAFVRKNKEAFAFNSNESQVESDGQSYVSNEDITAAYAMVSMDIDKLHVVAGVRYEGTKFETQGNQVDLVVDKVSDTETVTTTPWQVSKDYDYFLPSLNLRYNISDKLVTRFAYTNTIARPTFSDSAAYQLIETETVEDEGVMVTERKAEVGNPALDPYESMNLDASIEYYPGSIGVLSAGVFYKDIDNFIIQQEVQDNGDWDGFDEVVQMVNGGKASLTGIELNWNKTFKSGFVLGANGTFIDADEKLPNQADTVANIIVGFENHAISTRLSASYKSESFQFDDADMAVYEDSHMQLDFSSKYYLNDNMNVYFNATNLTDEPMYLYHGEKRYNYQYESYGRTFELGFTFSSL